MLLLQSYNTIVVITHCSRKKIKERKIYIPKMIHPWKGKSFEEFVKKQEHRLEDVA